MAFRFRLDHPIEKEFRRIAVEQIERARRQLAAGADPASAVHEVRKGLKRLRALLRLGRKGLGETVYQAENARYRAIAADLAPARDDQVTLETIVKLAALTGDSARPALERLRAAVLAEMRPDAGDVGQRMAAAGAALARAERQARRLRLVPPTFATLEAGLVRTYRRALAAREAAYAEPSDEAFHDWRKSVQTYWRHTALLSRAWPALFEVYVAAARELSQTLGEDHDLAILKARIAALPPGAVAAADADQIRGHIEARQAALRRAARPAGERLLAERPKAHGRRLAAIWEAAVAERRMDETRAAVADEAEAAPPKRARPRPSDEARG